MITGSSRRAGFARSMVLGLLLLASRALAEERKPSTPAIAPLAIDRAAMVIDVAAQRRALDENIRRELARRAAAPRESRARALAITGGRPRG